MSGMQSSYVSTRHTQAETLSIKTIPEQTVFSRFHQLLGGLAEAGCYSRLVSSDVLEDAQDGVAMTELEEIMMDEIVEFLETQPRKVHSAPNAVVTQLASTAHEAMTVNLLFESIVRIIAIQLLANCYTLLPATSASNVPLFHQRKKSTSVTALRLCSYHRFSPAAGYHAREPSETLPWPGLYSGTSLEDDLAEIVCRRRRLARCSEISTVSTQKSRQQPEGTAGASQWSDGPASSRPDRKQTRSNRSRGSASDPGFISRLICQASSKKESPKSHFLFLHRFFGKGKHRDKPKALPEKPRPISTQKLTSHSIIKIPIPSSPRLRRTQAYFQDLPPHEAIDTEALDQRRDSSTPTIGSPISYPYEIPEIRRISASTAEGASLSSIHTCVRGQVFTVQKHCPGSPWRMFDPGRLSPLLPSDCDPYDPMEVLSPLNSSELIGVENTTSPSDFFESMIPVALKGSDYDSSRSREQHQLAEADYDDGLFMSESDSSSENSVNNAGKRKPVVGSLRNSVETFSQRLQEREGAKSLERRGTIDLGCDALP